MEEIAQKTMVLAGDGQRPEDDDLDVTSSVVLAAAVEILRGKRGFPWTPKDASDAALEASDKIASSKPDQRDRAIRGVMRMGDLAPTNIVLNMARLGGRPIEVAATRAAAQAPHTAMRMYADASTPMGMAVRLRKITGSAATERARNEIITTYLDDPMQLQNALRASPSEVYDQLAQVCDAMIGDLVKVTGATTHAMPGCVALALQGTRKSWAEAQPDLVVEIAGAVPALPWCGLEVPHYIVVQPSIKGTPNSIPLRWGRICPPGTAGEVSTTEVWSSGTMTNKQKVITYLPKTSAWPFSREGRGLILRSITNLPLGMALENLEGTLAHEQAVASAEAADSIKTKWALSHF